MPDITLKDLESVNGGVNVRKGYVLIINCQHACNVRAEPNAESEKIGYAYANEKLPYYGKTVTQIIKNLGIELNPSSKDFSYHVCRAILGVKSKRIQEFENAGVSLKTIALEANRDYIVESMSFSYIRFVDIVNQTWEDSDWYNRLTSKFFFVVFRKSTDGIKHHMVLEKVFFWNMPRTDLEVAEELWNDTRKKVMSGDYNHFITTKSHSVCHVRPHGTKGQTVETPQGIRVQPKCFWLNNDYILDVVKKMMCL